MTASPALATPKPKSPMPAGAASLRNRAIEPGDLPALAHLLSEGFPARTSDTWLEVLTLLDEQAGNSHMLPIGFVLAGDEGPVGVLLTIRSPDGRRCSLSSWYVREDFRRFATMLVSMAVKDRSATYLNISSERHTRPIIEAQGFRRYADGIVLAVPMLGLGRARVSNAPPAITDAGEKAMAEAHARLGCVVLWVSIDGRAHPYIFARRRIANRLPAAQVVYCPPDADWRKVAGPIGRALLRRGLFCLLLDAAGPVAGLPGRFMAGRMPKFARGPDVPRLGDLAWTEAAVFGA